MEEGSVGEEGASWQGEASQLARKQTASFSLTRVRRASQVRQEKEAEALRPGAPAASPGASPARKVVRTSTFRKREASFVEELPKLKPVAKREWRDPLPPPGPARPFAPRDCDRPGPYDAAASRAPLDPGGAAAAPVRPVLTPPGPSPRLRAAGSPEKNKAEGGGGAPAQEAAEEEKPVALKQRLEQGDREAKALLEQAVASAVADAGRAGLLEGKPDRTVHLAQQDARASASRFRELGMMEKMAYQALEKRLAMTSPDPKRLDDSSSDEEDEDGATHPLDVLQGEGWRALGVDADKREQFLSNAAFRDLFRMRKAAFAKLPKWKRDQAKKAHRLF